MDRYVSLCSNSLSSFFFFFFFLLSSRNIVRSCNRVSEGKKSWTNDPYRSRARRTLAHFFFFLERKKPRNETITLREEPKDQAMIHVALFSIAFFFYIYIYVYLFVFYIYFKLDLKTYLLLSSAFFRSSRDPSSLFSILLLTTLLLLYIFCAKLFIFPSYFLFSFFPFISSKTSCQSLPFLNEDMLKSQLRTSRGILLIHITYIKYISSRHPMLGITDD